MYISQLLGVYNRVYTPCVTSTAPKMVVAGAFQPRTTVIKNKKKMGWKSTNLRISIPFLDYRNI
jgi:hypothetical protein